MRKENKRHDFCSHKAQHQEQVVMTKWLKRVTFCHKSGESGKNSKDSETLQPHWKIRRVSKDDLLSNDVIWSSRFTYYVALSNQQWTLVAHLYSSVYELPECSCLDALSW